MSDSIDALIFDAEGVTISTEALWDTVQHEFLAGYGVDYDRAALKPLVAGHSSVEALEIMQQLFDLPGTAADLAAERIEIARRHFTEINFVDGFPEFFASITPNFRTAMATAMDPNLFVLADARLGLTELFAGHVSTVADVGGRGKPAPDLFLHAATAISAVPARCVVFEDAPNGIEAAVNAGMHSVGLTTTFGAELLTAADLVIDAYSELDVERLHELAHS
jgi:HAD superfamily hydrolase (TIGR01509 family)